MNLFLQTKHIFDALCGYSPDEQKALQVLAVASAPLHMRNLKPVVLALEWDARFITRAWLQQATVNGLIDSNWPYFSINSTVLEYLKQQLACSGDYALVASTVEKILGHQWRLEESKRTRTESLALYCGDMDTVRGFMRIKKTPFIPCLDMPESYKNIPCTLFDRVWLNSLPDDLKFQFLYHMTHNIGEGLVHAFYLSDVRSTLENSPAILEEPTGACLLATIAIWQGDFKRAQSLLPRNMTGQGADVFALKGRLAFLHGAYEQAFELYRKALFRKRKECGVRKASLKGEDMIFQIFACAASKSASETISFLHTIRTRRRSRNDHSFIISFLECVLEVRSRNKTWPDDELSGLLTFMSASPFSVLCTCLGLYWADRQPEDKQDFMERILDAESYSASHQMHWLTWEFDNIPHSEALKASASKPALLRTLQSPNSDPSGLQYARTQIETGAWVSCLAVLPPEKAWERSLQALKSLTQNAAPNRESARRLAWLFTTERDWEGNLLLKDVEARLQAINKSGRWGRGRKVALERLYPSTQRQHDFPFLTEQDKHICEGIEKYEHYYNDYCTLDATAALAAASGHPLLFIHNMDTPLSASLHDVALKVEQAHDQIQLTIDPFPDGQQITTQASEYHCSYHVDWETIQRVRVYTFTPDHLRIAHILGEQGLLVPESAKQQALESIAAIAPLLSVYSEVEGEGQHTATKVEPDSRLHLRLQPAADGLQMSCFIRPFGDAPLLQRPAEGGHTIFTEHEGQTLQTRRDLKKEAELARAMFACCPFIDADEGWDWQLEDPQEALETLEHLNGLGDDVVLEWPEGKAITMANRMDVASFRVSMHQQQDWFEMEGDVQVGEEQVLGLKHLLDLVQASPGRFIRLGDHQFLSLSKALYQRLDTLQSITDNGRFHGLAAGVIEDVTDGMKVRKNRHWQAHLQKLSDAQAYQPELPSTLQAELRDYQLEGFQWMGRLTHWGAGACLADDMGLGKTVQALALILSHAESGPTLVIAPTSVCMNWETEVARFAPTLQWRNFATAKRTEMLRNAGPFDLIVCSYALLQRNAKILTACNWQTVVLDEAQAIKNVLSKRSKAAMDLNAQVRLITTGTPIENHLGELWTLFQFINPGLLGSLEHFNRRFANPIQNDHDKEASKRLKQLIQPFILRRLKSDVLPELPSRTEITMHVELSSEEMALYEATRRLAIERIEETSGDHPGARHIKILAEIMRLRRACCHPSLVMPETQIPGSKLAAFGACVEELIAGHHKALVFSQFVGHLTILRAYLDEKDINYQYLDGSTPAKKRKQCVDAFQAGNGDLFLISLKAGGAGLNLTAADYVLHMDPWWNPAVEDQASDRAHRIGQTRPVTIYRFIAKGTIEDKIVQLHQQKRALADNLLEGSDSSGKLSLQEIMKLVETS